MDRSRLRALTVAVVLLSTAGCSAPDNEARLPAATPTQSATPTPTPPANGGTYGSVTELRDAYMAAGGVCEKWAQHNRVKLAAESGGCDGHAVLSIYLSKSDIAQLVQDSKDLNAQVKSTVKSVWLTGENWVINDPAAPELRKKLGGTLVSY